MIYAHFGRHLGGGPIIWRPRDRIEANDAHALMVERPVRLAIKLAPLLAHVEVPVVLTGDEVFLDRHFLEQLVAEFKFLGPAELSDVAAENQEVGRRVHGLHFLDRPLQLLDKKAVDGLWVQMGVGNPGERKAGVPGGMRIADRIDYRKPACQRGPGACRGAGQERSVNERAPGNAHGVVGARAVGIEHAPHLAPLAFDVVFGLPVFGVSMVVIGHTLMPS
jgi:hypothetical protein